MPAERVRGRLERAELQLVSFLVEERVYGVDIRVIKEINPTVAITPVPRAPRRIKGLVNIRGQVVLVMDIATIFGRGPQLVGEESQIIIMKTAAELRNVPGLPPTFDPAPYGDKPLGLLVDRIGDVVSLTPDAVEPPPPHLHGGSAGYFDGVAQLRDSLLVILDVGHLLTHASQARSTEKGDPS